MVPNTTSTGMKAIDKDQTHGVPDTFRMGPDGQPASTYPGIWRYPTNRDDPFQTAENWMESKKNNDDIGNLWRVHDKVYDFSDLISSHPGGAIWLELSRGQDITEIFMASHVVNVKSVNKLLETYYVKDCTTPRNSPFTFKDDGFYMTLKRRVEPIFKKVGTGPTKEILMIQDGLAATFIILAILAASWKNMWLASLSGIFLSLQTVGSHNFVHLKNNWRNYYMDLSLISSHDWRITHSFSHHMFPNTLLDVQLKLYPTFEFMPNRHKPWVQQKFALFYSHVTFAVGFWLDLFNRFYHIIILQKKQLHPENSIVFAELLILMRIAAEPMTGFWVWVVMHTMCSYLTLTIGAGAGHHHNDCFVDGDEPLVDPDFGIGQPDASKDKSDDLSDNLLVSLVTLGHHPIHHLFPAVCHSKLHHVKNVFEETLREFKLDFPGFTQKDMYFGCFEVLARTEPVKREDRHFTEKLKNM